MLTFQLRMRSLDEIHVVSSFVPESSSDAVRRGSASSSGTTQIVEPR